MPIALYTGMENNNNNNNHEGRKMDLEIVTVYVSDCCGAYLDDAHVQHGICHECGEHCEIITEKYPAITVCEG